MTTYQLLKHFPLVKSINGPTLQRLANFFTIKNYKLKDQIYSPSDAFNKVFFLFDGQVKLYELSFSGKKIIVDMMDPGSIFGDISSNGNDSSSIKNFAESMTPSTIGVISKNIFQDFIYQQPALALKIIDLLSHKLTQAEEKIKDLSLGKIENRLLHELIRYAKKNGRETKRLYIVTQKITHEELAGMVGTTRETVTKTLNDLKRKRVIIVDLERHYRVDKQKLAHYTVY